MPRASIYLKGAVRHRVLLSTPKVDIPLAKSWGQNHEDIIILSPSYEMILYNFFGLFLRDVRGVVDTNVYLRLQTSD